ncbi:MAG TPA: hypothetical protein VF239_16095 [Vicinamibacterales bacterium]
MGAITVMVNNMMEMLADVPPMLASAWVVWFIVGGALVMWYRRAVDLEYAPAPASGSGSRAVKPASRPPSGVRREAAAVLPVEEAPFDETAAQMHEQPPVPGTAVARDGTPVVIGDPFGELATLLDQAAVAAAPTTSHRAPGDSPILSSSGTPLRRAGDREPDLG